MGRRPSNPGAIPHLRIRKRGTRAYYYYDHGGKPRKEEPLGTDYGLAIKRWAEIEREGHERPAGIITLRYVTDRYIAEVLPTKSPTTQRGNLKEVKMLMSYFDDPPCPLEAIEPQHVKQYIVWRKAKVRANRERALLSHIWNWAREMGYTKLPNPCAGVRGNRETGRDIYIEDEVFLAVWTAAEQPLRDAMDLAYLAGQRVADTLSMDEDDIRNGQLQVVQGKTGAKRRIEVVGELAELINAMVERKRRMGAITRKLITTAKGGTMSYRMLNGAFQRARVKAGVKFENFQFRDLRAKAGTDKAESSGDIRQAQKQLGHSSVTMTEHYTRNRRGDKVTPTR